MSDARAETLLKSALEKIVYFEARSEQLQSEVAASRAEVEQLKRELTDAAARELELRRQVAELEVSVQRTHREREELGRMNEALKVERTALLEKLIDSSRIQAAGSDQMEPTFDLASFIAELRSEVLAARSPGASVPALLSTQAAPPVSPRPVAPVASAAPGAAGAGEVAQVAERLLREGRLRVSEEEMVALAPRHAGKTEESLFGFSVRELSAPDAPARIRAAERLKALGQRAAAPALASALHAEREPEVVVALLASFAALAQKEGAQVVLPLLDAPSPEVRMAALKTLLALDPSQAGPRLASAAQDPDPAVRRRASLLALGLEGDQAFRVEQTATRDDDPEVRRLSALTLGAAGGERARGQLLEALRDPDARVRRAAAQGLSRLLGEDVSYVVDLEDAQRRREIRRLATLPPRPRGAPPPPAAASLFAPEAPPAPAPQVAPPAAPPTPPAFDTEALCHQLVVEMRSAIRGRSLADLAQSTRLEAQRVEDACALLVARGQVVRRGLKYFVA